MASMKVLLQKRSFVGYTMIVLNDAPCSVEDKGYIASRSEILHRLYEQSLVGNWREYFLNDKEEMRRVQLVRGPG